MTEQRNRRSVTALRWLRCPKCWCWFGTHDRTVLHGPPHDDWAALQLALLRGEPMPSSGHLISRTIYVPGNALVRGKRIDVRRTEA